MKTSGLGNITIRKRPKSSKHDRQCGRRQVSTSAGAKLCPRTYGEPQPGHRHELPTRRTRRSVSRASAGWVFLPLGGQGKETRRRRASFRLSSSLSALPQSCGWLSHVFLPSALLPHFSASGAAAGPKGLATPKRPPLRLQHTTRGSSPPGCCCRRTSHRSLPLRVLEVQYIRPCNFSHPPLTMDEPPARERGTTAWPRVREWQSVTE